MWLGAMYRTFPATKCDAGASRSLRPVARERRRKIGGDGGIAVADNGDQGIVVALDGRVLDAKLVMMHHR